MRSLHDLLAGVRRHPARVLFYAFVAYSVLWTVTEGLSYFVPGFEFKGSVPLTSIIVVSASYALNRVWKPSRMEIKVAHTDTTIEVLFGDLFAQSGLRAIAVGEFFDSEVGQPVSERSVHGMFLLRCFGGHPEPFDKQVAEELRDQKFDEVPRPRGKTKRYPIGSVALVTVASDRYLAFAFARTDPVTCKAESDVTLMWVALHNLWQRARIDAGGEPVNLPLVGSGLSGLGLPTRDLLNLIILSAITETKAKPITQRIRIVLHRSRFDDVDLRDVGNHWKE